MLGSEPHSDQPKSRSLISTKTYCQEILVDAPGASTNSQPRQKVSSSTGTRANVESTRTARKSPLLRSEGGRELAAWPVMEFSIQTANGGDSGRAGPGRPKLQRRKAPRGARQRTGGLQGNIWPGANRSTANTMTNRSANSTPGEKGQGNHSGVDQKGSNEMKASVGPE